MTTVLRRSGRRVQRELRMSKTDKDLPYRMLRQPRRCSNRPTAYARVMYYRPDNARVRVAVDSVGREYNAFGDVVDGDVMCRQHRHSGLYDRE